MEGKPEHVTISRAIESLRIELKNAAQVASTVPEEDRYTITEVEVELSVALGHQAGADAKVGWWVIEAGTEVSKSRESVHTVKLKLDIGEVQVKGARKTD